MKAISVINLAIVFLFSNVAVAQTPKSDLFAGADSNSTKGLLIADEADITVGTNDYMGDWEIRILADPPDIQLLDEGDQNSDGWKIYSDDGRFIIRNDDYTGYFAIKESSGDIGIGDNPQAGWALSIKGDTLVDGKLEAEEIEVTTVTWADFVFDDDYELMPLEKLDAHIKQHGHLPGIPSEKEVVENGINLGDMNARLVQKIEELTLHLIALNKRNKELAQQIEAMRK